MQVHCHSGRIFFKPSTVLAIKRCFQHDVIVVYHEEVFATSPKRMQVTEQRWTNLCAALGLPPNNDEFARVKSAYSEPHRAYHTLQHLSECLEKFDWAIATENFPNTVFAEAALWYHDVVYRPTAKDNERRSAEWAVKFLSQFGIGDYDCRFVASLIMATCHVEEPEETTHQLVVDIDFSILGAEPARFDEYERQVREEYKRVPWLVYKKKRKAVLKHFLDKPSIYAVKIFHDAHERQARENLKRALAKLS